MPRTSTYASKTTPIRKATPDYIPYVPGIRDLAWQNLYRKQKGQIDEQFGFLAFRTAPLVSSFTMDAKVVTSDMANRMMVWAEFGKPNQSVWQAPRTNPGPNHGLYPGGYYLLGAEPRESLASAVRENEAARLSSKVAAKKPAKPAPEYTERLWKGWVLPASDNDTWFVAGSASYYRLLQSKDLDQAIEAQRIRYRGLKLAAGNPQTRFQREQIKGALFLDGLRRKMGDDSFFKLMEDYFAANTTKPVTAQSFLDKAGASFDFAEPGDGPSYLPGDIGRRLTSAVIVYGTVAEAGTNRYAAEQLQTRYRDYSQVNVAVYKDFEVSDDMLAHRDVIFVGRPASNSALAEWAGKIGLRYDGEVLQMNGETFASERNALVMAANNPLDAAHMVLIYAGNDPWHTVQALNVEGSPAAYTVLEDGKPLTLAAAGK